MDFLNIPRLTDEEFDKFAKLIHEESGIFMKPTKITLLSNRLRKRLQSLKLTSFSDYYDFLLKQSDRSREIEELLDVVSTNETYFFRNERHFDALLEKMLPDIANKKKDRTLRIWSAGCSTGEEPYTIAICVNEKRSLFQGWNIEIIATDIAYTVLEFARVGRYSGRRIEKVPSDYMKKYFNLIKPEDGLYEINNDCRKLIKFGQLNLFKDPFPKDIDIIFCRNVMIYFDREHQRKLVADFYKSVSKSNGYLLIGHSETLHSISESFTYVKLMEAPVYVPVERINEFNPR